MFRQSATTNVFHHETRAPTELRQLAHGQEGSDLVSEAAARITLHRTVIDEVKGMPIYLIDDETHLRAP